MLNSSKSAIFTRSFALFSLFLIPAAFGQSPSRDQELDPVLERAAAASRLSRTLSGDILLTWRTAGVTHQTKGTVQLAKPNLGRITLQGDYPEVLLVSNGQTRYLASSEDEFEEAPMDKEGARLDSPWWGLPFRFFFTQSVNPFGATPDKTATYGEAGLHPGDSASPLSVLVKGNSPMGAYIEKLAFNAKGDLVGSSVQFGEGPNAALFQAMLTNVRHGKISGTSFHFVPKAGQAAISSTDGMLPLGATAPVFSLRTPEGKLITLDQELRGKKGLLVNFWYYNCAPCRVEFPEFENLYKQFVDQGFGIVAINKGDTVAVTSKYVAGAGLTFPVVLGGNVGKGSIFEQYKVTEAFPGSYLLNEDGKVVYRTTGADIEGLKSALRQLGFK